LFAHRHTPLEFFFFKKTFLSVGEGVFLGKFQKLCSIHTQ